MSKQAAANKMLLVTASANAVVLLVPKSVKTTACIMVSTSHHDAKASLNFLSDKDDADKEKS